MKFTVILIYPDYLSTQYGEDFYCAHVETPDHYYGWEMKDHAKYALYLAQKEAWYAQGIGDSTDPSDRQPEDFALVSIFEGHIEQAVSWDEGDQIQADDLHEIDRLAWKTP